MSWASSTVSAFCRRRGPVQDVLEECDSQGAVWFDKPMEPCFQKTLHGFRLWFSGEDNFVLVTLQEALTVLEAPQKVVLLALQQKVMPKKKVSFGSRGSGTGGPASVMRGPHLLGTRLQLPAFKLRAVC